MIVGRTLGWVSGRLPVAVPHLLDKRNTLILIRRRLRTTARRACACFPVHLPEQRSFDLGRGRKFPGIQDNVCARVSRSSALLLILLSLILLQIPPSSRLLMVGIRVVLKPWDCAAVIQPKPLKFPKSTGRL